VKYINNKLKHYPDRLADYLKDVPPQPVTAQIQIIDKCCFGCFYCDKEIGKWDRIEADEKLISRLKELGVRSVILTGGEPLMHKNFDSMMLEFSKHFKVGLVTTLYRYSEVLETVPTWVKVSLDSVNPAEYGAIKGINPKMLATVLENMKRLYDNKDPEMVLGAQMVITDHNQTLETIEETLETVKDSCDYLQLRPIESLEDYEYSDDVHELLRHVEDKYEKIVISDKFYVKQKHSKCYAKWMQLLIGTDSNVKICCNRVHETVASLYDPNLLQIIHDMKLDMKKCYTPCVMSVYNQYISESISGPHQEFV